MQSLVRGSAFAASSFGLIYLGAVEHKGVKELGESAVKFPRRFLPFSYQVKMMRDDAAANRIDVDDPRAVLEAAVEIATGPGTGGFATLSTASTAASLSGGGCGISSRVVQPMGPAIVDGDYTNDGETAIFFHTTRWSEKYNELKANPRCNMTFVDTQGRGSYASFSGTASRVSVEEEKAMFQTWPGKLRLSYPDESSARNFTAWRLDPDRITLVDVKKGLGGGERRDWAAPCIIRQLPTTTSTEPTTTTKENKEEEAQVMRWSVVCRGGLA
jgi:general stress protein 26